MRVGMSDTASAMGEEGNKEILDYGKCPGAAKCKGEYRDKGCDGMGKIQGGIATYPFFGWWPIKVYRPCPSFQDAGYIYRREGQTLDQVLFSEPSTKMQEKMTELREEELEASRQRRLNELESEQAAARAETGEGTSRVLEDSTTPEETKFLEDRFGKE